MAAGDVAKATSLMLGIGEPSSHVALWAKYVRAINDHRQCYSRYTALVSNASSGLPKNSPLDRKLGSYFSFE